MSYSYLDGSVGFLLILFKNFLKLQIDKQLLHFLDFELVVLSVIFLKDFSLFSICMTVKGKFI